MTIKWIAMSVCLVAMSLAAANIFPAYLFVGVVGTSMWLAAGIVTKDKPLYLGEIMGLCIGTAGIINWFWST